MKWSSLVIAMLFISATSFSQTVVDIGFATADQMFDAEIDRYHYMLADSVHLRSCPSRACSVVGMLHIGQRLVLEKRSDQRDTINHVRSHWYYIRSGQTRGWVFGGAIAQTAFGSRTDHSVKFVFGPRGIDSSMGFERPVYELRAFKGTKELDRRRLLQIPHYLDGIQTKGSMGLDLDDVIVLDIPCVGGCGCSAGELVVFWNGTQFSEVVDLLGTADAWASEGTQFIYPVDMEGEANTVIKISEHYLDEVSEDTIRRAIRKEYLVWNGSALVPDPSRKGEYKTYLTSK